MPAETPGRHLQLEGQGFKARFLKQKGEGTPLIMLKIFNETVFILNEIQWASDFRNEKE
jgi:hypothetical protein